MARSSGLLAAVYRAYNAVAELTWVAGGRLTACDLLLTTRAFIDDVAPSGLERGLNLARWPMGCKTAKERL